MKLLMIYNRAVRLIIVPPFALIFFLSISSCATQAQTSNLSAKAMQTWSVTLSISGGFAGLAKNIHIDSNGLMIINNFKNNKRIQNKINNKKLRVLSNLIYKRIKDTSEPVKLPVLKHCADCFQYKLSIRWQNGQQLAALNDLNLRQSAFNDIVLFLRKMASK